MAEENRDMLQIRLHVYDTEIPVKVPREEEEYYRKAAKLISDTVNSYSSFYKKRKTEKDILYMSLIDIALKYEMEAGRNDTAPYSDILGTLTSEIEEALKK